MQTAVSQRGAGVVAVLVVLAGLGFVASFFVVDARRIELKESRAALVADAHDLHAGFMRYRTDVGEFPHDLDLKTLAPVGSVAYFPYTTSLIGRLRDDEVLFYVTPSPGDQFWLALQSAADPSFIVVIAHTNQLLPTSPGWWDGVYVLNENGLLAMRRGH